MDDSYPDAWRTALRLPDRVLDDDLEVRVSQLTDDEFADLVARARPPQET